MNLKQKQIELAMTESIKAQQALLFEDSEELDTLLQKDTLLDNTSSYDLGKIPGVLTPAQEQKKELPIQLTENLKKIVSPVSGDDDNDASERSEEGYLPATLRSAISVSNKPQVADRNNEAALCMSPPLPKRNKKKPPRTLRRNNSDKLRSLAPKESQDDGLAQSLHVPSSEPSAEDENLNTGQELERLYKSEELKKSDNRVSEKNRRKSENLNLRPPRSSPRTGKQRKNNSAPSESSRPASIRKPKSHRSRSKEVDKQFVDWKRTTPKARPQKQSEEEAEDQKPKKSSGSTAPRSRRSKSRNGRSKSKSRRSLSRGRRSKSKNRRRSKSGTRLTKSKKSSEDNKKVAGLRKSSPRQDLRKRSPKLNQSDKLSGSIHAETKKPRSRRTLMISSKAKTPSCRNLLRKIHMMNDDRLSRENKGKRPEPIEELSKSTLSTTAHSTNHSLTDMEETNHSYYSFGKPQEVTSKTTHPRGQEEKRVKPPRTKSDPLKLVQKNKSIDKISKSSSNNALSVMALANAVKKGKTKPLSKRSIKQSLSSSFSGSLLKFGLTKNSDDMTARMGNRSKDKQTQRKPLQRSRSDSSLGIKPSNGNKRPSSRYDLMISNHSTFEDFNLDDFISDSDDEESFSGEDHAENSKDLEVLDASNREQSKSVPSTPDDGEKKDTEASVKVTKSENSMESEMISMASFEKEETRENKKLSEHMTEDKTSSSAVIKEGPDDILSMAEFSETSQIADKVTRGPKKPPSCLQIDFSQLSENGTSGNIVVRSKKLERRIGKSSRELRVPRSPALAV